MDLFNHEHGSERLLLILETGEIGVHRGVVDPKRG
jgi:hypothetical protein